MPGKVAQHKHCQICGKAIPTEESFCSEECREKYENMMKKRKWYIYIMYGAIFFIIAVFVLSYV